MNLFKSKIISALSSLILILSVGTIVSAQELNLPGFTGTVNTTVTSGVSMRLDRNCLSVRGTDYQDGDTGGAYATLIASEQSATNAPIFLKESEGCATRYTDGYGNTGSVNSGARDLISANADNGRTNFDGGDIFDITQRAYSEVIGKTDSGMSVNLSFVGAYNPVVKVNGNPEFAPFSNEQKENIETDLTLLNAYVSQDLNADHSVTVGRFVTSWGESTFIPIGMNGLTTNAVDLAKLRTPGASIKEALIPTEQITFEGFLSDGWSYEAYLQFNEGHVELEESGQFFGNEVAAGDRLIVSGQFSRNDQGSAGACGYLTYALGGNACNAATVADFNSAVNDTRNEQYLLQAGLRAAFTGTNQDALAYKSGFLTYAAPSTAAFSGGVGNITQYGFGGATTAAVGASMRAWDVYDRKQGEKAGAVDMAGGNHIFADGEDQFGLSLRKFLPNVGTGIDLGFHFTQYDSKVPYLRMKGQGGLSSGDLFGIFQLAGKSTTDRNTFLAASDASGGGAAITALSASQHAGLDMVKLALANVAYGEAACGAYMKKASAAALYGSRSQYTSDETTLALNADNYTVVNGKLYHDAVKCFTNSQAGVYNTSATQVGAAALLGAAVTPLNAAEYEFIYPENLQAFGVSANTNIGTTAVQLELTFRPDFPLATDGGDQGQQMSDAVGTTGLLSSGVLQGLNALGAGGRGLVEQQYNAGNGTSLNFLQISDTVKSFKRSYLPIISAATVMSGDYYSTPYFEHDVLSGTVGTTSLFAASHPITTSLGADSTVLLTEVGFVSVDGLSMAKPVARNGYRDGVGGAKCGGVTQGGALGATNFGGTANYATSGATHLASSQTDPLFGNGNYCESKNNADDFAMTYRVVGSASYNNIANSPWNLSNSLVWSHDFKGYAPTSLGGFVPGRQSLSLSSTLTKGAVKASLSYVGQFGDKKDNLGFDMDYVSGSLSYAF